MCGRSAEGRRVKVGDMRRDEKDFGGDLRCGGGGGLTDWENDLDGWRFSI